MADEPNKIQPPLKYFFGGCLPKTGLADMLVEQITGTPKRARTTELENAARMSKKSHVEFKLETIASYVDPEDVSSSSSLPANVGKPIVIDKRGVAGGSSSNRRCPGEARRRVEVGYSEGLGIIKELQAQRPRYGDEVEYWRNMVVKLAPFTKKDLLRILQKKSFYEGEMERLARRPGAQIRQKKATTARGCRRKGAGRKDDFSDFKVKVLHYAKLERQYGHTLTHEDLWREFTAAVELSIADLEQRQAAGEAGLESRIAIFKKRLVSAVSNINYLKKMKRELAIFCGLRYLRPMRVTKLSETQEEARLQCSVQDQRYKLWVAAFGSVEELGHYVADPEHFIAHRKRCVVGTNDQVPVWIRLGSQKQLYFIDEKHSRTKKQVPVQPSQRLQSHPCTSEEMTQLRGDASSSDEKFRITFDIHTVGDRNFDDTAASLQNPDRTECIAIVKRRTSPGVNGCSL